MIDLVKEASTLGKSKSQVNARDTKYTKSGPIPEWIKDECREKGIYVPESPAEIALLIFESLATAYKEVINELQDASGIEVSRINIVGGGSANDLLNQLTANSTGLPVISGPTEATAYGNLIVQLIALGEIKNLNEGRTLISNSISQKKFLPK